MDMMQGSAAVIATRTALTLADPRAFDQMRQWNAGSVVGRGTEVIWPVLPFLVAGMVLAALVARPLNTIALGDELASSLGTHVLRTRIVVVLAVTALYARAIIRQEGAS